MAAVVQEITTENSKALRSYQRILDGLKKIEGGLDKIVTKSKEAGGEQEKLAKKAERLGQSLLTPQEKHAAKLKEINELAGKQLLTEEQKGRTPLKKNDEWLKSQLESHKKSYDFDAQAVRMLGYQIASYLSINAAIQFINASLQHKIDLEKESLKTTLAMGDAQRTAYLNIGPDLTPESRDEFDRRVGAVAVKYAPKGGRDAVYRAMNEALAASSGTYPQALSAVEQAIRFAPHDPQTQREVAGGILDIGSLTGSADAEYNMGMLAIGGKYTRISDWPRIAKNISQGATGVKPYGGTAAFAEALVVGLTVAARDKRGETSATAATSMVQQLERFLPEGDINKRVFDPRFGRYRDVREAKGTGLKTTEERLERLRKDPKLMEQFLRGMTTEKVQTAPVRQIITGVGPGAEAMAAAYKDLSQSPEKIKALVSGYIETMDASPIQGLGKLERHKEQAVENLRTSGEGFQQSLRGEYSLENLQKIRDASGQSYADSLMTWADWYLSEGGTNEQAFKNLIKRRVSFLRNESPHWRPFSEPSSGELEQANILESFLNDNTKTLESILEELKKSNDRSAAPHPTAVQNNRGQHGEGGR